MMQERIKSILLIFFPCAITPVITAEESAYTDKYHATTLNKAITAFTDNTKLQGVQDVDEHIHRLSKELDVAFNERDQQQETLKSLRRVYKQLSLDAAAAQRRFNQAKKKLDSIYKRMLEEPDLDIVSHQTNYQETWAELKQFQQDQLTAKHDLDGQQQLWVQKQAQVQNIQDKLSQMSQKRFRARASRLQDEISRTGLKTVNFSNVCDRNITLSDCINQTESLTQQKAVMLFQDTLVSESSEPALVKQNLKNASFNIHVLRSKIIKSNFVAGDKYRIAMDVELEARPNDTASCKLLDIESRYCFAEGVYAIDKEEPKETPWVNVLVRSDQYNDSVYINGVSYGSTPIEILLPVGDHAITIKKEGFYTYHKTIDIKRDKTVKASLSKRANKLYTGKKFADSLGKKQQAPQLVTITEGQYLIGENNAKQVHLDNPFAIGVTPITVRQFDLFIASTNYKTDAELTKSCTVVNGAETEPVEDGHWKSPGFKQDPNAPVVCISKNDALAYINWLSDTTGYKYRLPTENEWEIAARGGSDSKYWWGEEFQAGKANTGWGGTPWSNKGTSPVSAFEPNELGIYDMVGNVWEWTNDQRGLSKGGAWSFSPSMASHDKQLFVEPNSALNYVGFRVVRELN
ncbi:SUMF1/EgtB/PvdO family nonheme iron enzyme [Vibrio sp.]|nr:SUMF1/EgtB/PvdO family nonheme iron enzyme [Vibrio sp.]